MEIYVKSEEVKNYIDDLVNDGWISKSYSSLRNPCGMCPKKGRQFET